MWDNDNLKHGKEIAPDLNERNNASDSSEGRVQIPLKDQERMVSTTTVTRAAEKLSSVLIVPVEPKQGDNHPGCNSGSLHIVPAGQSPPTPQ